MPKLRQLFGRDIEIVLDLSPDVAPVVADPAQVRQDSLLELAVGPGLPAVRRGTRAVSDSGRGLDNRVGTPYESFCRGLG